MANFGGYMFENTLIESSYRKSVSQQEMELNLKASFKSFINVDASTEMKQLSSAQRENFQKNTDTSFFFYGGEAQLDKSAQDEFYKNWKGTVTKNPWIFSGKVKPMWDLIADQSKRTIVNAVVMVKLAKRYLSDARDAFEMSAMPMSQEVKQKLDQIEQALQSASMESTTQLEKLNADISGIIGDLQKQICMYC